jgi:phosphomannomutase
LHYGRDALIGIGLFLSHLAQYGKSITELRRKYPDYFMSKNKIELQDGIDVKQIFEGIKVKYKKQPINTDDGLKIEFEKSWVHLRASNTEPIIRVYSESETAEHAEQLALQLVNDIKNLM